MMIMIDIFTVTFCQLFCFCSIIKKMLILYLDSEYDHHHITVSCSNHVLNVFEIKRQMAIVINIIYGKFSYLVIATQGVL